MIHHQESLSPARQTRIFNCDKFYASGQFILHHKESNANSVVVKERLLQGVKQVKENRC